MKTQIRLFVNETENGDTSMLWDHETAGTGHFLAHTKIAIVELLGALFLVWPVSGSTYTVDIYTHPPSDEPNILLMGAESDGPDGVVYNQVYANGLSYDVKLEFCEGLAAVLGLRGSEAAFPETLWINVEQVGP